MTELDVELGSMINNAGVGGLDTAGKIHEMTEKTWDFTMYAPFISIGTPASSSTVTHHYHRNVNARSVFLGCKYAIAQFLRQEPHSSGHRGWIINTASMLGLVGFQPSAGAYCASKGAVVLLTKQIAVEYGKEKIHCNALCPACTLPMLICFNIFALLFKSKSLLLYPICTGVFRFGDREVHFT